jgi:hypothetical protein
MKIKNLTLLVAMLVMVLGIGSFAVAQVAEEPLAGNPVDGEPKAGEPVAENPVDGEPKAGEPVAEEPIAEEPAAEEPVAEESCADIFLREQIELAEVGVYPTSASEEARACEDSGETNPYPAPYFYDEDGFLYTYNPINDHYISSFDNAAGGYRVYDLVSGAFYTYDPVSGTYT